MFVTLLPSGVGRFALIFLGTTAYRTGRIASPVLLQLGQSGFCRFVLAISACFFGVRYPLKVEVISRKTERLFYCAAVENPGPRFVPNFAKSRVLMELSAKLDRMQSEQFSVRTIPHTQTRRVRQCAEDGLFPSASLRYFRVFNRPIAPAQPC